MYKEKQVFFDNQVNSIWANNEYTAKELFKIERIFSLSEIKSGAKVIEPGCGTGRLTELISKRCGNSGKVIAFDISPGMIKKAEKRLRKCKNIELSCAHLEEIEFNNEGFDIVFCHQVFPHFEDQFTALKILANALKQGGKLLITHLVGIEEINDVHRKSNSPVENDIMPSNDMIKKMLERAGLSLILLEDNKNVFNILAEKIE